MEDTFEYQVNPASFVSPRVEDPLRLGYGGGQSSLVENEQHSHLALSHVQEESERVMVLEKVENTPVMESVEIQTEEDARLTEAQNDLVELRARAQADAESKVQRIRELEKELKAI